MPSPSVIPNQNLEQNHQTEINTNSFYDDRTKGMGFCTDEIVISGISCRMPESENMEEFSENLFNGVDMVTDDGRRWTPGLYGLPTRSGKLKSLDKFDASFFGVHPKQANRIDPQLRILLELTHEALIDSGVNPSTIRGSRTGVFIGASDSESKEAWLRDPEGINGYGMIGCSLAMFANRISYTFDLKGPSFTLDAACASSLLAVEQAVSAIRSGKCEAAIVGGVNILLKPQYSLEFQRLNLLAADGKCKAFDASGQGYVRSEAAVVIYIQKRFSAKRCYATILHAKNNTDGYKEEGLTSPAGNIQKQLLEEAYTEIGIDPAQVSYVEAHGTGTNVGDTQETNAIADFFCKGRKADNPLLIGSVKSNMGHSEPASGLCGVAKVILAMQKDLIPANLHFNKPKPGIAALNSGEGLLKVVKDHEQWEGGLAGIMSFGLGGANVHVILQSNPRKNLSLQRNHIDPLPFLVPYSGRTKEAVEYALKHLESKPRDEELYGLFQNISKKDIPGHNFRGYALMTPADVQMEVKEVSSTKTRPVWFVFSGMGSQWSGMGKDLLQFQVFKNSIKKSAEVLINQGIQLEDILENGDESAFSNVLISFVAITSIQIALVDLLFNLGITPDGIIGHSVGELACAYADGCFTAEQTVLAAYARGKALLEANLAEGAMAAVGLTWEETKIRCPSDIFPACHNGQENVSISGPVESIKEFIQDLKIDNIFAKEIKSSGVGFHSKYIASVGKTLQKHLERIIPEPKKRSVKWVSSSIPKDQWNSPLAQTSSADYHVNNLLSPVLFHEAVAHIPDGALVIEISPHCLLQSVLKSSLSTKTTIIGLMNRNSQDNSSYFLSAIGKTYLFGLNPLIENLYPKIQFPVTLGTPMISPMVKWDHSISWDVAKFGGSIKSGENIVEISLKDEKEKYLTGHTIDGRNHFPGTGYMMLVWKTLAKLRGTTFDQLPVVFENVHFVRATILQIEKPTKFSITIFEGSEEFELQEGGSIVVTGNIRVPEKVVTEMLHLKPLDSENSKHIPLISSDVYKELGIRGYDYKGIFKGIITSDNEGNWAKLKWEENWVSFLDSMVQFYIFGQRYRGLCLPTKIQRTTIDPHAFKNYVTTLEGTISEGISVSNHKNINVVKCPGIEMRGLKITIAPRKQTIKSVRHQEYTFMKHFDEIIPENLNFSMEQGLRICTDLVIENSSTLRLKVTEIALHFGDSVSKNLRKIILDWPTHQIGITLLTLESTLVNYEEKEMMGINVETRDSLGKLVPEPNCQLTILHDETQLYSINSVIGEGAFILLLLPPGKRSPTLHSDFNLVAHKFSKEKEILLLRKKDASISTQKQIFINVESFTFGWVEDVKRAIQDNSETSNKNEKIYLLSINNDKSGIMGLINCLKLEPGGDKVRGIFMKNKSSVVIDVKNPCGLFKRILQFDLVQNVISGEDLGSYRHFPLKSISDTLVDTEHAYINSMVPGDLSSIRWIEGPLKYFDNAIHEDSKELCEVFYAPLNFRDIMLATGKLPPDALPGNLATEDCVLGLEFSGKNCNGERVMGLVPSRGLATTVVADKTFLWKVPQLWTLEEAATVPVCYATAYYALIVRGRMKPGESVLIHSGSGGVGQAAISIALSMNCKVFTTVGSKEKKERLQSLFHQLKDENFSNSRDTTFEQDILEHTNRQGVNLVLNSLAEDKLQASVRCLAQHGRFLEIGKFDLSNDNTLRMAIFLKNITFHGILLDALFEKDFPEKRKVVDLVERGIKSGVVKPLPCTVYSDNEIEQAFRFMASGKHVGKVVLKLREEFSKANEINLPRKIKALPRTYFDSKKSCIIIGGLGGMGLELAEWLQGRGVKKLVLVSRSGITSGYQDLCVRRLRENGMTIETPKDDVTKYEVVKNLILRTQENLGPLGSIFNLAMVLRLGFIENQTQSKFVDVGKPKIDVTINMDKATRTLCPMLDHFVVFSSVVSGKGMDGQSNYGFANSVMERICEIRQQDGLPGIAVQWGAIGDVGALMDDTTGNETVIGGTVPQRISSVLNTLDAFLWQNKAVVASNVLADRSTKISDSQKSTLLDSIANILGMKEISNVNENAKLAEIGMDSLMVVEVKQTLERDFDMVLFMQEIRKLTMLEIRKIDLSKI